MRLPKLSPPLVYLFLILVVATFFRFFALTSTPPGLYPDEAVNGNNIIEIVHTGQAKVFYPENGGREGLFINIQALSYELFQQNRAWVLRLPSALIGVFTVLGLYFLVLRLATVSKLAHPQELALLAAFLAATSVWHIIFSRIGLRVIMGPLMAVWSSYFLVKAGELRSQKYALLGAVILGLGFYTYTAFRIFPFVLLLLLPLLQKQGRLFSLVVLITGIVSLPLAFYFLAHPLDFAYHSEGLLVFHTEHAGQALWGNIHSTLQMFVVQGDANWRHNLSTQPQLSWILGPFFLLGILIAAIKPTLYDRFFLGWLLIGCVPAILSYPGDPHALRTLIVVPAALALAARGLFWVYLHLQPYLSQLASYLLVAGLAVILLAQTYELYFIRWAHTPDVHRAFTERYAVLADQLNKLPDSEPKYVVLTPGDLNLCFPTVCVQSVMFLTNTYLPEQQRARNLFYLQPLEYDHLKNTLKGPVFLLD